MNKKEVIESLLKQVGIRVITDESVILPTDIQLNPYREKEFYTRLYNNPLLAFGEMYMEEVWSTQDLVKTIKNIFTAGLDESTQLSKSMRYKFFHRLALHFIKTRIFNLAKKRPYEIGQRHYDCGNDLYKAMLGPSMTYSCGLWAKGADSLESAQFAKFKRACDDLLLSPRMRVLDIGCGFGSFAKYAAENYGVEVVGITVSEEQAIFAREHCTGLPVEIRVCDYRLLDEQFDAIVSFGMFEHVQPKNYQTFFRICAQSLKSSGKLFLHTIASYQKVWITDPFIDKWIFPNSYIPTEKQTLTPALRFFAHMKTYYVEPENYAKTLTVWYENFKKSWSDIEDLYQTLDYSFYRLWEFYLCSCIALFQAKKKYVLQILFEKK